MKPSSSSWLAVIALVVVGQGPVAAAPRGTHPGPIFLPHMRHAVLPTRITPHAVRPRPSPNRAVHGTFDQSAGLFERHRHGRLRHFRFADIGGYPSWSDPAGVDPGAYDSETAPDDQAAAPVERPTPSIDRPVEQEDSEYASVRTSARPRILVRRASWAPPTRLPIVIYGTPPAARW